MHVRFTTCLGLEIVEDSSNEALGQITGILIDPDTGKVEGLFALVPSLSLQEDQFVSTLDIIRWGTYVYVRSQDVFAPAEDRIRLATLLNDPRTFLGQPIRTESGRNLGKCGDVQFDTKKWNVDWLYPRKWFRWAPPFPISEVIEVKPDAIIVKDPAVVVHEKESVDLLESLPEMAEKGVSGPAT